MKTTHIAPGYILTEKVTEPNRGFQIGGAGDGLERFAKVIAIGPTFTSEFGGSIEPPCKPGDTIIWTGNLPVEIRRQGQEYRLIKFTEVCAIVEEL